jgi:regulator of cell morphogenesis and NO signaling
MNQMNPERTMNINPQTRIGDMVLETPAAMRVFEQLNVDYCCGGHRSLAEACAHAGRSYEEVAAKLAEVPDQAPAASDPAAWKEATLSSLIAHIEATHHVFTRSELARVAPLMEKVLRVHGEHHPELARISECFTAMADDLGPHLEKEEQILFPYVRAMESGQAPADCCFGTVQNPVRAMQYEHEQVGDILRELRTLTRDYTAPEDACGSYRSLYMGLQSLEQDLHLHIYLESHLLFPGAVALEDAVKIPLI